MRCPAMDRTDGLGGAGQRPRAKPAANRNYLSTAREGTYVGAVASPLQLHYCAAAAATAHVRGYEQVYACHVHVSDA